MTVLTLIRGKHLKKNTPPPQKKKKQKNPIKQGGGGDALGSSVGRASDSSSTGG